ncbi:MAG TPA: hypothetical protein VMW35_19190 [Myxococcota bacterium]|jgi:hypothetical protein|nr:hypothetical protein [Myxococcota bacterium]
MKLLRWLVLALLAFVLCLVVVGVAARFSDGPIGPFPGGPLVSGPLVADANVDWSALANVREVELQLVTPARSRTTWFLVNEGKAYVPCGFPNAGHIKQWPHELARDPRVVLRIDGRRYELQAVKVDDAEEWRTLAQLSATKYGHGVPTRPDDVWYFRLEPRAAGAAAAP